MLFTGSDNGFPNSFSKFFANFVIILITATSTNNLFFLMQKIIMKQNLALVVGYGEQYEFFFLSKSMGLLTPSYYKFYFSQLEP